ncbi:MAG: hypothetical protein AAFY88_22615, partial [Acidobacteriota bacterium]
MMDMESLDRHLIEITRGLFSKAYRGPLFRDDLPAESSVGHIATFLPDLQLYLDVLLGEGEPKCAILHEGLSGDAVEVWSYVGFDAAAMIVAQLSGTEPDPEKTKVWELETSGEHWQSKLRFVFIDGQLTPVL